MTTRTTTHRKALKAAQVLDLPAMTTLPEACAALGISTDLGYETAARGEFPIPVVKLGARVLRVRRADLLAFLGLEDTTLRPTEDSTAGAGGMSTPGNDDSAGVEPAPSVEHINETASQQIGSVS